ncbi:putative ketimine reductase mu-crystallin-like [Apostichopus japonicus]|uniref:Ketimine reductase mu-crystallin n=1 Tax=Stichopus japonicus TaxID=307972 RepID=A0A2G8L1F0_STIJA|nr:putative ketimine reductase mu-crystallin-like [Apostichopus japonicus]
MAICNIDASFIDCNLKYKDLIPVIEECMANFSRRIKGEIEQPVRTVVRAENSDGSFFIMPVYSKKENIFINKIVTVFPNNASQGIPVHQSLLWLYSGSTGVPKAIMHCDSITLMRTAAASAVATKYLAPKNSKIHTILGAGGQAHSHLEALAAICNFDDVRVWNHNYPKAEAFAKKHGVKAYQSAEEAVRGADVITLVTLASTPVLFKDWVKEGAHINGTRILNYLVSQLSLLNLCLTIAVGAPVPFQQEIEPALMRAAVVYVDSLEGALKESGDIIKSQAPVFGEIGEMILGKVETKQNETTIFKSLGMAMEDLVTANLVYNRFMQLQSST